MLLEETLQRCSTCAEVTPHSRRRVAVPKVLATLALVCAAAAAWEGGLGYPAAVILVGGAGLHRLSNRERRWRIHCERCREKERAAYLDTKPKLGTTIIDIY